MTTAYNPDGTMAGDAGFDWGKLLGGAIDRAIGQESDTDTTSNQTTTAQGTGMNQNVTDTTQRGTTHNTGVTNTDQTVAGTSRTNGTTQTAGASRTSGSESTSGFNNTNSVTQSNQQNRTQGTTRTNQTGSRSGQSQTATIADISRLLDVYARQSAGVTPEMLAAIFREGSKQAPNALLAQSSALGARASGNTPVAVALNMLNRDMVDTAARQNVQLLRDAGATAAQIAEYTKNISSTSSEQSASSTEQIQDVLSTLTGTTRTSQNTVAGQTTLKDLLTTNNQVTDSSQITDSLQRQLGTTTTDNYGTTNQAGHTNQVGTNSTNQTQNVAGTENRNTSTTINQATTKGLVTAAAGGLGVAALLSMAREAGFTGAATELVRNLVQWGGSLLSPTIIAGLTEDAQEYELQDPGTDIEYDGFEGNDDPIVGPLPIDLGDDEDVTVIDEGDDDWSWDPDDGFADGGMVNMPNLLNFTPLIKNGGTESGGSGSSLGSTTSLMSLLNAVTGSRGGGSTARPPTSGGARPPSGGASSGAGAGGEEPGGAASGGAGGGGGGGGFGGMGGSFGGSNSDTEDSPETPWVSIGKPTGQTIDNNLGPVSSTAMSLLAKAIGLPGWLVMLLKAGINKAMDSNIMITNPTDGVKAPVVRTPTEDLEQPEELDLGADLEPIDIAEQLRQLDMTMEGDFAEAAMDGFDNFVNPDTEIDTGIEDSSSVFDLWGDSGGSGGNNGLDIDTEDLDLEEDDGGGSNEVQGAADGGRMVNDKVRRADASLLKAFGITLHKGGSMMVDSKAAKRMAHLMRNSGGAPHQGKGLADGGKIQGPGTGISDSIPARTEHGTPLKVANGEYIISKDVVDVLGVDFFDALQDKYHVPADLQRAMGVK